MMRDGLRLVLEREEGFKVVGEAGDVRSALECVRKMLPDLVLLDVQMPDGSGLDAARQILSMHPSVQILMLSGHPDQSCVNEAICIGVSGYLAKDEASNELVRAIHAIMEGKVYLCPFSATALANQLRSNADATTVVADPKLSERELEVLRSVVAGMRNKEIADRLGISVKSVESYRARLMSKTGCSSPAELVRYALKEGHAAL
jgi:DNA-binding NarL/FixJ family response regulator